MVRFIEGSRNKKKKKLEEKKKNPYKIGGRFRTMAINETSNPNKKVLDLKKSKKKSKKRGKRKK